LVCAQHPFPICWGGRDRVDSVLFINVPENDAELIEKSTGDWIALLKKYGTKEDIFIAESYGIYISSSKLPKIQ